MNIFYNLKIYLRSISTGIKRKRTVKQLKLPKSCFYCKGLSSNCKECKNKFEKP